MSIKVVAATNAMKGTLTALYAAELIASGVQDAVKLFKTCTGRDLDVKTEIRPVADGGDDTVDVLAKKLFITKVSGPFKQPVDAQWGAIEDTAVIELAKASGIALQKPSCLDPFIATTFGTGELIAKAIDSGYKKILLAIGGSATVDGGIGALSALGVKFYDAQRKKIEPFGNNACGRVRSMDITAFRARCKSVEISIACDVDSPLLGPTGSAAMFGPQKLAPAVRNDPVKCKNAVAQMEQNLSNFSNVMVKHGGVDVSKMKGIGAAGAFSLGFCSFGLAKLEKGADLILKTLKFEKYKDYDVAFTCEGFCDSQTLHGKAPFTVCQWMKNSHVVVLTGGIESDAVERSMYRAGANVVTALVDKPMSLEQAIKESPELMRRAACREFFSYLSRFQ